MSRKFVYFGCSWTYGKFINLAPGSKFAPVYSPDKIDKNEFIEHLNQERLVADQYAYRSLIAKYFDATQLNLARVGSSNDRQFRYASERYLGVRRLNPFFRKNEPEPNIVWPADDPIESNEYIIWFITSVGRKEFFHSSTNEYHNEIFTKPKTNFAKMFVNEYYDEEYEVERTAQQMLLWNAWFEQNGFKNCWVNTFNHYDYPLDIPNLINFDTGLNDLMSNLCINLRFCPSESDKHQSDYINAFPGDRAKFLVKTGYLNTTTMHPTIEGHKEIAKLLIPKLKKFFVI